MTGEGWTESAACRGKPTSWWFVGPTGACGRYQWPVHEWRAVGSTALAICADCPVKEPCRDEAIITRDFQGIRGGLTPPELASGEIGVCRCGRPFEPHSRLQLYCSMTCSERARRGQHVNEKVGSASIAPQTRRAMVAS